VGTYCLNRRLFEVLEQTAVKAFGSVRQRVAAHLLDLASDRQRPRGRLVARVSQQELADAAPRRPSRPAQCHLLTPDPSDIPVTNDLE